MSEQIPPSPGADGSAPVPRDPPDQQADGGQDPWEAAQETAGTDSKDSESGEDVPETDEAGTGRRGNGGATGAQSEEPVPQEPSG
ncbi:hypothetical protein [Streptomyces venezuelae]|uniref:hypothetical protein n=1 Tax=Streptomyces venezuelae TaxID=54571 RepID=UPI0016887E18|nr:hypothetical protein [Streptomyces venezuelae]